MPRSMKSRWATSHASGAARGRVLASFSRRPIARPSSPPFRSASGCSASSSPVRSRYWRRRRYSAATHARSAMPAARSPRAVSVHSSWAKSSGPIPPSTGVSPTARRRAPAARRTSSGISPPACAPVPRPSYSRARTVGSPSPMSQPRRGSSPSTDMRRIGAAPSARSSPTRSMRASDHSSPWVAAATPATSAKTVVAPPARASRTCPSCPPIALSRVSIEARDTWRPGRMQASSTRARLPATRSRTWAEARRSAPTSARAIESVGVLPPSTPTTRMSMSSEDVPGSPARRASAPSSLRRALPGAAAGGAPPDGAGAAAGGALPGAGPAASSARGSFCVKRSPRSRSAARPPVRAASSSAARRAVSSAVSCRGRLRPPTIRGIPRSAVPAT